MKGLSVLVRQTTPIPLKAEFICNVGELLAIVGPSGSGKSTLLRCIAGLYTPEKGSIYFNNQPWLETENKINRRVQQRNIGFVFQDYALFEHKTVLENIQLATKGTDKKQCVKSLLQQVNLEGLEARYPSQLSGGQKQRVAIARALAGNPSILLLDEPFSSVDAVTRRKLRLEMLSLVKQLNIPIILVTHDLNEASFLADSMVVLHKGETLQQGIPEQVLRHPKNSMVARLVDVRNLMTAEVLQVEKKHVIVNWQGNLLELVKTKRMNQGDVIHWCIRPMDILLHSRLRPSKGERENAVSVRIQALFSIGGLVTIVLELINAQNILLQIDLSQHVVERNRLQVGETLSVSLVKKAIHTMYQ